MLASDTAERKSVCETTTVAQLKRDQCGLRRRYSNTLASRRFLVRVYVQFHSPLPLVRSNGRRGLTVIELTVAMAIIGLLVAVILPAIQSSREAARQAQCANHFKQIGLALHNYVSTHGNWPGAASMGRSWQVSILPYVGEASLYDQVDHSAVAGYGRIEHVRIPLFLCPTDSIPAVFEGPDGIRVAATSYLGCSGTCVLNAGFDGMFRHLLPWRPDLYADGAVRDADVTDGMTHTAAVSEVLHSTQGAEGARLRIVWNLSRRFGPTEYESFRTTCAAIPENATSLGLSGSNIAHGFRWVRGNIGYSTYDHALPPQSPSCFNGSDVMTGIFSAASLHRGSVNVLFADGRTIKVANQVDQVVWLNYGSRSSVD